MTLYDAYGRPIDLEALKQPQAAPTFVGLRNIYSVMRASSDLTCERLVGILRQAELGDPWPYFELAEEMEEKDLHYLAVLSTRKQSVAQLELIVKPADNTREAAYDAAFVREVLLSDGGLNLQSSFVEIQDAVGKGVSATEIEWDDEGDGLGIRWVPRQLHRRDPRWFLFDWISGEQLLVRSWVRPEGQALSPLIEQTPENARIGIQPATAPLTPYKFITHVARAKSGLPIRGGLARAISWIYLFKNFVLKDAVIFSERFGMPARLGKYEPGATVAEKDLLLQATAALGSDAAAIVPKSMEIELLTAKAGGSQRGVDIYEKLLRYFDSAESKAVLGQDFTTELPKQGGSRAAAQVGKDIRDDILRWDAMRLNQTVTRDLVRPVVDLNLGPRRRYPSISLKILGAVDARAFMDAAAVAADHGVEVGQDAVRDVLGIPAPLPGEKLLTPRQTVRVTEKEIPQDETEPGDLVVDDEAQPTHASVVGNREPPEPDDVHAATRRRRRRPPAAPLEGYAQAMARDWRPVIEPLLEPIRREIMGARSLPEAKRRLAAAAKDMGLETFVERMARAGFNARMAARHKVALPKE